MLSVKEILLKLVENCKWSSNIAIKSEVFDINVLGKCLSGWLIQQVSILDWLLLWCEDIAVNGRFNLTFWSPMKNLNEVNLNKLSLLCTDAVIEQAGWDSSELKSKLVCDSNEYIAFAHAVQLAELTVNYEVWSLMAL